MVVQEKGHFFLVGCAKERGGIRAEEERVCVKREKVVRSDRVSIRLFLMSFFYITTTYLLFFISGAVALQHTLPGRQHREEGVSDEESFPQI